MLRSIKQLYGDSLGTDSGPIGEVKDFYFDDLRWAIRYVIVDTGSWLSGRQVLISPHAFGRFYEDGDRLLVDISKQQIEDSPAIEEHKPVSRHFEEEYFRHYGWPAYWQGGGVWGHGDYPVAPPPPYEQAELAAGGTAVLDDDDPHLRSTSAVRGYHIQTADGPIGHVTDFLIDDRHWTIRHLVVETGHWYAGKEIVISPKHIDRISYEESSVLVNVSRESIKGAREYHMPHATYHDSLNFEE